MSEQAKHDQSLPESDNEAEFLENLKDELYQSLKLHFWDTTEEKHDFEAAESFIKYKTGITADIVDTLLMIADDAHLYDRNSEQIFTFINKLMRNKMDCDSAREMATIFSEYYIEFGDEIIKHYKAKS